MNIKTLFMLVIIWLIVVPIETLEYYQQTYGAKYMFEKFEMDGLIEKFITESRLLIALPVMYLISKFMTIERMNAIQDTKKAVIEKITRKKSKA